MTFHHAPPEPLQGCDPALFAAHRADEHLWSDDGGSRCSLWWRVVPVQPGERLGVIGHFAAASAAEGGELLRAAVARLGTQGCTLAVGPMDGNTWRRYRAVTERGGEPAFVMEPDNPDWWAEAFTRAGFEPLAHYSSTLVEDLQRRDPRWDRARERLRAEGIRVRPIDLSRFADDLRGIHRISVESFSKNFLYADLPEDAFLAQYLPYREVIRPELVLIAEENGRPVGFLFGLPDLAERQRGEPVRTAIGKTLAVLPGRRYGGLGLVLTTVFHQRAAELGFQRVIHALQHEDNDRVRHMSAFFGRIMRRYTLYAQRIG